KSSRVFSCFLTSESSTALISTSRLQAVLILPDYPFTSFMTHLDWLYNKLKVLKLLGIKIAIDDFGTRYASLNYLQQLPFDILKIDQCFVRDVDRNSKKQAITKAIIDMAHQLGLKVIAEGVETEGELQFLRQNGCDEMQGYLFSRPVPFSDFKKLIKSKAILSIK
ncbi:EAL domain-containing protein, partial [Floridanema evergladense]